MLRMPAVAGVQHIQGQKAPVALAAAVTEKRMVALLRL
jgi:hypothetical protein